MKNIVNTYVQKFRADHRKFRRMVSLLLILALLVSAGVFWQLHSDGIAMANETYCGVEEHTHTEDCYDEEGNLICGQEEHVHTATCLSDETADTETAEDWEATLPELTGVWADDVVAIAESQLGYTESTANYTLAEDGETRQGYTRYGAWAGNEYGDWDAMFASFCLYYAGISTEDFPESTGAYAWAVMLQEQNLYAAAADYTPTAGDLVFFDTDGDGKIDTVGIVVKEETETGIATDSDGAAVTAEDAGGAAGDDVAADSVDDILADAAEEAACIYVILGDCAASDDEADAVCKMTFDLSDERIVGYGVLPVQEPETEEKDAAIYTAEDNGVTVTVKAPAGALPEGAELVVALLDEESDDYAEAAEAVGYDAENEETDMAALDIAFYVDGEEVEPVEAVTVTIDASGLLPEEADASTIEVQHLAETEEGVEAVLVADATDDTEGTVDAETATAEFKVESFSTFTVTWSSSGPNGSTETTTLSVTVYVDGTEYTGSISNVSLSSGNSVDLTTLLSSADYTFSKASVSYTANNSDSTTDAATAITYTKNGPNGSYTITTGSSSISNVSSISSVSVYYESVSKDPSVKITAEKNGTNTGYDLTAVPSNFTADTDITYTWSVNDSSVATVSGNGTSAALTWAEGVADGTSVTVSVTATRGSESDVETATTTYTLTSGSTSNVTFSVYYPSSSGTSVAASGVTVYVYDSNGDLVSSGTTDSTGKVTFELIDGETYTVKASYTSGSYTYSFDGEVTADATNGNVISLVYQGSYEHIDVKYTSMSDDDSDFEITGVTSVVIYDSEGKLVDYTKSITNASGTSNWQAIWTNANGHSISFSLDYTVVITYTAKVDGDDEETYVITIDSSTTYPEGTYYPVTGDNAYQLYNYIYGTSYTESTWASSSAYANLKDTGIDIGGMTYFEVAIALCDSWGDVGKASGLDFALGIQSMQLSAGWNFEVQKTLENGSMSSGEFTFRLYEAEVSADDMWTQGDFLQTQTNSDATADSDGDSQDTVSFTQISYSTSDAGTYYYIIREEAGDDGNITYDDTVYGVKVVVSVTSSTSNGVTTYTTTLDVTYYKLTAVTDAGGNITGYTADEVTTLNTSSDGLVIFPFTNTYSDGYELPSAGGAGTWAFTLAGLLLCGGAGANMLRRRRQRA